MSDTDNKPENDSLGEGGMSALRAERAENKNLKAANKALEDRLSTLEADKKAREEADLTALQKAEKQRDEWKAKAEGFVKAKELDDARASIAEDAGVPANLVSGTSVEEMTAHAALLKAALGPQQPAPSPFKGGGDASDNGSERQLALNALGFGDD